MTPLLVGILHPLSVPLHLAAVLALALLIGQQRWGWSATAAYAAAMLAGLAAIAAAFAPVRADESLLTLAAFTGLLVALAWPLPRGLGWVLAAAVGATLALDSPPEAISLWDANLTLAGTALGAIILLLALTLVTSRLRTYWQSIGVRIIGSWIAASAILVLALRIVR